MKNGLLACALLTSIALADASARAEGDDWVAKNGWGTSWVRAGLDLGRATAREPIGGTIAKGTRTTFDVVADLYTFFDSTVFGTLLGAEASFAIGSHGRESLSPAPNPDPAADAEAVHLRMEGAYDFDLLRFKLGPLRFRLVVGAGLGFDVDGRRWFLATRESHAFTYPQLVVRPQFWIGQYGFHGAWHWLPVTSVPGVREHRFEVALSGIGPMMFGARYTQTQIHQEDQPAVKQEEFGGFVTVAF